MSKTFFILLWLLYCCNQTKKGVKPDNDEIICIRISRPFPVFEYSDLEAKLIKYDPSETKIYFYTNQELYQEYYHSNTRDAEGKVLKSEYRCGLFVFSKDKSHGLFYDSARNINDKMVSVDSMLAKQWCYKLSFDKLLNEMTSKLISSSVNKDSGELRELYSLKGKNDTLMSGSILFTFTDKNKFKEIDYSFSNKLDSIKNMKLFKVDIINNARELPNSNFHMDKVETTYLLEKIPVTNKQEIMKYFEKERARL